VAGGRGAGGCGPIGVAEGDTGVDVGVVTVGEGVRGAVGVPVGVAVAVAVVEGVAEPVGVPLGVAVAVAVVEGVADPVGVALGVVVTEGVPVGTTTVGGITWFETVAWHVTSAPPPLPEPLHWSMWIGSVAVVVEPETVQTNPTLVPPFPDPLHWPTVACCTEVTPAVFAGVQVPGAPVPVMTESTHW